MNRFLIIIVSAFILFSGFGCEEYGYDYWEISPLSRSAIIQKEVDGIEFKFCLLNEAGEAAAVFNEGDNFTFHFSVTNRKYAKLCFDPDFAYYNNISFCQVNNSDGTIVGKPFNLLTVALIGPGAYPFNKGDTYTFEVPWSDDRNNWDWGWGYYESTHQELLERGEYYTEFKYRFQFIGEENVKTDTLTFKINFRIR